MGDSDIVGRNNSNSSIVIGSVVWNWVFRNKNIDSEKYDKLNKKMKLWLGFNGRFVSESFINEDIVSFKELYENTSPNKKWLFWIEYFFTNILNRNVLTLLQQKITLANSSF